MAAGTEVLAGNALRYETLPPVLKGVDVAYYLIHSMGSAGDFEEDDRLAAANFGRACSESGVEKIVYLGHVTKVKVNGNKALWIKGPHELIYIRRDGTSAEAPPRLTTGITLLWGTRQAALRLEGNFGEKTALAIARSAH